MSELALRPRFQKTLDASPQAVLDHFETFLGSDSEIAVGTIVQHHIMIRIPKADLHYWSPQLDLELEEDENKTTLIRGLVGPSSSVWTKFVFLYFAAGFAAITTAVIALSQWTLGKTMWGLWGLGLSLAVIIGTYLMGQTGKKLAHEQTWQLKYFFNDCIDAFENQSDS